MGRFVCHHEGYFFEWSTVVDAPVTYGVDLEQFTDYYRSRYGELDFEHEWPKRLERALATGCSSRIDRDLRSMVSFNHAGFEGTCLTFEQIIQIYCVEKRPPVEGEGVPIQPDT